MGKEESNESEKLRRNKIMLFLSNICIFITVVLIIMFLTVVLYIKIAKEIEGVLTYGENDKDDVWINRGIAIAIYLLLMLSVLPHLFNYLFLVK